MAEKEDGMFEGPQGRARGDRLERAFKTLEVTMAAARLAAARKRQRGDFEELMESLEDAIEALNKELLFDLKVEMSTKPMPGFRQDIALAKIIQKAKLK